MESDYRTVMREEFISKKMGILEDLEDMKMEAEEKKRKDMRKKRKLWDSTFLNFNHEFIWNSSLYYLFT